ncbi:hypothetical protein BH23BAC3_BH23BAC3_01220 [soil metagenome]
MNSYDYTLLIIESPTIAPRLQQLVPQNVVVIATKGYLWAPLFKKDTFQLSKKAIPDKLDLRNKIRKESRNAVNIIIATDSDPSGDFIAWSLADELRGRTLHRGNLHALSKTAVEKLITNSQPIDNSQLHKRLENRYIIQNVWKQVLPAIDIRTAAAASIFGTSNPFKIFKSEDGGMVRSLSPVHSSYGSSINDISICHQDAYHVHQPLSTFKILELIASNCKYHTLQDAQNALYKLFETKDPQTDEGLITYPRTESASFFPDTWYTLRQQWIQSKSISGFIPPTLKRYSDSHIAHDSIRPADINARPDYIAKHIPSDLGILYNLVHSHTMRAISMPAIAKSAFRSNYTGAIFASEEKIETVVKYLTPSVSISDFGHLMNQLGVLRPSGFGVYMDMAVKNKIIELSKDFEVKPGTAVTRLISKAEFFKKKLNSLQTAAEDPKMNSETIRDILTF